MSFVRNFPFFSIILAMFSGIVSSVLSGKKARNLSIFVIALTTLMSAAVLAYCLETGESYTYMMGHFPAPWGNEIRASVLEGVMAVVFGTVMLLSVTGGLEYTSRDVEPTKQNLFYILIDLMLSSLLALIYTNDLFTAYVFVEINTIAGCGLIMIRQWGRSLSAAIRYMVMSSLGSGLFLIGLSLLYDVTGQLLMTPAKEAVQVITVTGEYRFPMLVILAVICIGLAIKSGLYPFHYWIPDTYGYATPTASAILSGLVSKGYIFLLIKIFFRVMVWENVIYTHMVNVLFLFGIAGMLFGSMQAIMQKDTRKMIAYSSVAQIGYIYMGIGLGTYAGMVAAIFHIFTHAATKALLFISAVGLYEVSGGRCDYLSMRGAGYRNRLAGFGFTIGALSMVGFPMLSGFISKLLFATSALQSPHKMLITLITLAVSTVLNAVYFLRLVISLYRPTKKEEAGMESAVQASASGHGGGFSGTMFHVANPWNLRVAIFCFVILNLILGLFSQPIVRAIGQGLMMFE